MVNLIKPTMILLLSMVLSVASASDYTSYLNEYANSHDLAIDSIARADPGRDNPAFNTDNPDEIHLFNQDLDTLGTQQVFTNEQAQSLYQHFYQAPRFVMQSQNSELSQAHQIQDNAQNILQGISNADLHCANESSCIPTFSETTCLEPLFAGEEACEEQLIITVQNQDERIETIRVKLNNTKISIDQYIIFSSITAHSSVSLARQTITDAKNISAELQVIPNTDHLMAHCPDFKTELIAWRFTCDGNDCGFDKDALSPIEITIASIPTCADNLMLTIAWYLPLTLNVQNTIDLIQRLNNITEWEITLQAIYQPSPLVSEYWEPQCKIYQTLGEHGVCEKIGTSICLEGPETRVIHGMEITRDCWQRSVRYQCATSGANTCAAKREAGCEQIGSRCIKQVDDICLQYQQVLRCPETRCPPSIGISCDREETFCQGGDCTPHTELPFDDAHFIQVASSLSALDSASDEFKSSTTQVFKGTGMRCRSKATGFSNCCANKGWGQDIGLAHCDSEENRLGTAKEKNLCAYVGEYCDKRVLGVCITRKKTYCCFDHSLAAIVQIQGRAQLGLGYGAADNPDCRGLRLGELQSIHFEQLDFSNFSDELAAQSNFPNPQAAQAELMERIHDFYQQHQ